MSPVREVAATFLRLGTVAFGGPAAHIGLMREEIVRRKRWVTDERFVDLLGMTNLIPGPNSTEMAIHLGYTRAGWPGLVAGGAAFIIPATLIVLGCAWAYERYGALPEAQGLLYGVKPVIIAVVAHAMWSLVRTALKSLATAALAAVVLALAVAGFNEIALLLGSGAVIAVARGAGRRAAPAAALVAGVSGPTIALAAPAAGAGSASLGTLFLVFLKIGAVLYGSGYVLLAFLQNDFVDRLGWLTDQQLLDAVAVGQFTPGPVFTTATFIGYLLGGWSGAVLATVGIFLPSFVFVALSHPLLPRIRRHAATSAFLDGVNAAALALMAAVTLTLARAAIVDVVTAIVAVAALGLLLRGGLNSAWLVLGGGVLGVAWRSVG